MIKYYKISDEELKVDKDVRGAVYNSIALKKFKWIIYLYFYK